MRNAFADEITKLASSDPRIVLLSGDIGNKLFDNFKNNYKNRFYNCGIAEANMMGVAAGMAMSGLRPVIYTITPFTTTRCFEQIRVDVCYHKVPVTIVGTGSGLSYAELGPTHHSLEDLAILRTLPDLNVTAPCDANELRSILRETFSQDLPTYIRIGKKGETSIHEVPPPLKIGKSIKIKDGDDLLFIVTGTIAGEVLLATDLLREKGIGAAVVSMHSIKPLDNDFLSSLQGNYKLVITVEEHGLIGGLGSAVAEWRSRNKANFIHHMIGTPDEFMHETGSQDYARRKYGLKADQIANDASIVLLAL
jgi:transketolase